MRLHRDGRHKRLLKIGGISRTPEISPYAWVIEGDNLVIDHGMVDSLKKPGGSGKLDVMQSKNKYYSFYFAHIVHQFFQVGV